MAKINIKLNSDFLKELTGSLQKSSLEGNKKLMGIFDLINTHDKDNTIDIKEITDFANSIFTADTNNDGEVDVQELETYVKANQDKFKELKIKAKDIMEFFKTFADKADKTDENNQRITNPDGSYSIIYEDYELKEKNTLKKSESLFNKDDKYTKIKVTKKINYSSDNKISTIETTNGNKTTITDAEGNFITEQTKKDGKVVSEKKANGHIYNYNDDGKVTSETKTDGLTYYYEDNKTTIKEGSQLLKEIITLENGEKVIKEYKSAWGKTVVTSTNETTGEISKETIYDDSYYIHVEESSVVSLRELKESIDKPISSETYHTIDFMGKDIVKVLAKEDDDNFKKTYITGVVNKIIELAELVGENASEVKAIQKEIQEKGFENVSIDKINQAYSKLFEKIQKANLKFTTSKINNDFYKSEHSYSKILTNNKIIITDSENNKTVIDKNKLLRVYSQHDKNVIWDVIKDFPAEALLDLAAEVTFQNVAEREGSGASFNFVLDKINIGDVVRAEDILHELGHAIDCKGKGSENNFQTKHNAKFRQAFIDDMKAFEKAGNKRCIAYYDKNGAYQVKNGTLVSANSNNDSTYATVDEQEMFGECYALLMGGTCQSQEVIDKYFRNTLACVQEIVESTRKLPKSQRHVA